MNRRRIAPEPLSLAVIGPAAENMAKDKHSARLREVLDSAAAEIAKWPKWKQDEAQAWAAEETGRLRG